MADITGPAARLAGDLHERLAMQAGFNPELDDWDEWWRRQVTEALEVIKPVVAVDDTLSYQHRDCDAAIQADNLAGGVSRARWPPRLTLDELLAAVEVVDAHIDAATAPAYRDNPLALDWARITKVCEEAGEVWRALSKMTGENPRKGVCGTKDELLGELGDTASAAICAIQHLTKDTAATWVIVSAALIKARQRVSEHAGMSTDG